MIGRARRARLIAAIMAAVVVAAFAPLRASGQAGDDDGNESVPLTVVADFNHDGIPDIAVATSPADESGAGRLTVSLGEAPGKFRPEADDPPLGHAPRAIVTGDFNRDGNPDVIVGDEDGSLKLFLGDGTGKLAPIGDIARMSSVVSIAVADFNHDGIPDMAVSDWRGSSVAIFLGSGNGSFERLWSFPLRMRGTVAHVAVADFNGDGIPDLAVTYGNDDGYTFDVLVGNGKGAFTDAPKLSFTKDPNAHCPT